MPRRKTSVKTSRKSVANIAPLKDLVARATRILFHQKLADYHGHVSARVPGTNTFLIKPFLIPLNKIRSSDILALDLDEYIHFSKTRQSQAQQGQTRKNDPAEKMKLSPRETILHAMIYKARPDVFSVVHTHQTLATAFSIAGIPLLPVYFGGARYAPETPILQNTRIIDDVEMAQEAAQKLGRSNALLLRNHGVVIVGATVEEATAGAVYLERNAHLQIVATLLGNPQPLPEESAAQHAANMNKRAAISFAYFESLYSK